MAFGAAWLFVFLVVVSTSLDALFVKGQHQIWWRCALWATLGIAGLGLLRAAKLRTALWASLWGGLLGYLAGLVAYLAWLFAMSSPLERIANVAGRGIWLFLVPLAFPLVAGTPLWGMLIALFTRVVLRRFVPDAAALGPKE